MGIEEEIDNIFLNNANITSDQQKIKNLQEYYENLNSIKPYLNEILAQINTIKVDFEIYNVQLEVLAKELNVIQNKNQEIEEKLTKDEAVFSKLKKLVLALNIDDTHLRILDNGNFNRMDDIIHMEEALKILSGFEVDKFTIRIVIELKDKILQCQKNFYKRFVNFLDRTFVKSESTGELKVHKDLYGKIKQYKFIFIHSKKFPDCFELVFGSYILHSKKLYEFEFNSHLESILKLINDLEKINIAIEILIKSLESLIVCEQNYLTSLIDSEQLSIKGTEEIFKDITILIFDFLDKMFQKSQLITILALSNQDYNISNQNATFLHNFKKDLKKKYELLSNLFVKEEEEKLKKTINVQNLNQILNQDGLLELKMKLLRIYLERFIKNVDKYDLNKLIARYKIVYNIKIPFEIIQADAIYEKLKIDTLNYLLESFEKQCIDKIFNDDNEEQNIKDIIAMIKSKNNIIIGGEDTLLKTVRKIVLENCSDTDKPKYSNLFKN